MDNSVKDLISDFGGYRNVAVRLGKQPTTVHTHMQGGALPAAWFNALCDMAREFERDEPDRDLFTFIPLKYDPSDKDQAA